MKETIRVLSLGAGVQSSTLLLMADRLPENERPHIAVFADTGDEPGEVYRHYEENLRKHVKNIKMILTKKTVEGLMGDYETWLEGKSKRASSIPFFTKDKEGKEGRLPRQCSNDYKIKQVWAATREYLGYMKGQRFNHRVEMWIGISTDEWMRAKDTFDDDRVNVYPLLDWGMSRKDCLAWLKKEGFPQAPKSSCIYCPYHSDRMWQQIKDESPVEFEWACQVDEKIRHNPKLDSEVFVHRSCIPLRDVEFKPKHGEFDDTDHFNNECEGICGV